MAKMTFQFLDVGMGDGTLVIMGDEPNQELALIDFGECRSKFKDAREDALTYLVKTIDTISKARKMPKPWLDHLFLTHPHKDHYNAVASLYTAKYPSFPGSELFTGRVTFGGAEDQYGGLIGAIQDCGVLKTDALTDDQHSKILASGAVTPFAKFTSNIKVYLLHSNSPLKAPKYDLNELSLCLMFEDGAGNKVILMGDAGDDVEQTIITNFKTAKKGFLNAYALKMGHHGSKFSTSNAWLNAVVPKAIFASGDIVWAHPYCEAIDRVIKKGSLEEAESHWYCCGTSDDREYFNRFPDRQIFMNLWYVVKSATEKLTHTETGKTAVLKQGCTMGVQWQLEFDGIADPTFKHSDTWVPSVP